MVIPAGFTPNANVAASALPPDIAPLLDQWRFEQGAGANSPADPLREARFVLNFPKSNQPADERVAQSIAGLTALTVSVGPLFEPDVELNRHRLLRIPNVSRLERSDMFDIARVLRHAAGAETVEPDLGTNYYQWDGLPQDRGPESADNVFWCWAGESDKPVDPDWAINSTKVPQAWALSEEQGRPARGLGIRIFQPDTGVVEAHPELPAGLLSNPGAISLLEPNQPPIDPMRGGSNKGHGTGTGSVVASPEGGRMRGVAPLATLVPVRCLESVAVFEQSNVARAIDHARRNGAHVITMSLGGVFSEALHSAVRKAYDANIIVLAAAGNCVGTVVWPARYEEAVAVGGINSSFKPWRGSSHGDAVAVSGPAEFVLRADPRIPADPGSVSGGQGTSFATAHLAGLAGLWLAHYGRDALIASLPPGVKLQSVFVNIARRSAVVPPDFDTGEYGAGIVDAVGLLRIDPSSALGHESVFSTRRSDVRHQLAELLAETTGAGGLEAAAPALGDMQNAAELACIAFDRLRAKQSRRAAVEAMPPISTSTGLRQVLGQKGTELVRAGAAGA